MQVLVRSPAPKTREQNRNELVLVSRITGEDSIALKIQARISFIYSLGIVTFLWSMTYLSFVY